MNDIVSRMRKLINEIRYLYTQLHIEGNNEQEEIYESKRNELESMENIFPSLIQSDSPSLYVGPMPNLHNSREHLTPMLSLEHTYDMTIAQKRLNEFLKIDQVVAQEKVDGVALSLQYTDGYLDCALLRGNGYIGENVVNMTQYIKSIIKRIPINDTCEIRGELYLPISDNIHHNRSALAGFIRRHEPANHGIEFIAYGCTLFNTHIESMSALQQWGFNTVTCTLIQDFEQLEKVYMHKHDFDTDGIVIKCNTRQQEHTARYIKGSLAIKYTRQAIISTVNNISFTMSRQNNLIPLIHVNPVIIDNMRVTKVAAHNYLFLQTKNINIGTQVSISRVGNTAPQIINIVHSTTPYILLNCPFCQWPVQINEIHAKCINEDCVEKQRTKAEFFIKSLNIEGLGTSTVNKLIEMYGYDYIDLIKGLISKTWVNNKSEAKIVIPSISRKQLMIAMGWPQISETIINKYLNGELSEVAFKRVNEYYKKDKHIIDIADTILNGSI